MAITFESSLEVGYCLSLPTFAFTLHRISFLFFRLLLEAVLASGEEDGKKSLFSYIILEAKSKNYNKLNTRHNII